ILAGAGDPATVLKRYILFTNALAGFVRERALESLGAFGPQLVDGVIGLLRDADPDVRAGAISMAAVAADPRIVPPLIDLLKDSDWWIRISAADVLGRVKDPRSVDALTAVIADPDVKWAAIEALGRIGDARALPALGRMLGDPAPEVRIEVMQALRHFQHPQVKNALLEIAQ